MGDIDVAIGIDVDAVAGWLGSYGGEDSPADLSRGLSAGNEGIPRMLTVFESEGVETSWFVPGHSLETFRENMQAVADAGHELGVHGYSHENPTDLSREQEAAIIERSIELIEDVTGSRPVGHRASWWEFSENTPALIDEFDFRYDSSAMESEFEPRSSGQATPGRRSTTTRTRRRGWSPTSTAMSSTSWRSRSAGIATTSPR
jgi:peptidoglycan/xylan/chitin deacetylase (PgdA/CDA1 family)